MILEIKISPLTITVQPALHSVAARSVIGPNVSVFVLVKIANCPSHCWEGSLAIKIPLQVSGGALLEYLAVVQDEELHHISLNITPLHYIAQNHQVSGH